MMRVVTIISLIILVFGLGGEAFAQEASPQRPHFFEVSTQDVQNAVARALEKQGAGTKVAATLASKTGKVLYDYHKPMNVEVKTLTFEGSKWSANLYFVAEGEVVSAVPANGKFETLSTLPVLSHNLRNGDIIAATDIEWRDYPTARVRNETILDPDLMIGKTARRSISPQRPVMAEELTEPAIVRKNAMVKMHYRTATMEITTSGQVLDSGAKGDVVSVKNLNSNQVVRAVVESAEAVTVSPPRMELAERMNHGL